MPVEVTIPAVTKTGNPEIFRAKDDQALIQALCTAKRNATMKIHVQEKQLEALMRVIEMLSMKRTPGPPSAELEELVGRIVEEKS
jgi:hypothetical protein